MSKIEELIKEHCPDGVEYKTLGEVVKCTKGTQLNKNGLLGKGYPVINGGINPSGYWNEYNFEENKITISQGGASAGYVNYQLEKFWAGAHCYVLIDHIPKINYKFLYYVVKQYEKKLTECQYGAGIPALASKTVNSLSIPVPPLPVQEEIVRILDNFTELEAELEAELDCRKRQYEYYRNKLLSFSDLGGGITQQVKWVKMSEIAEIRGRIGFRGYTRADLVSENEGAITLSPSNIINEQLDFSKCSYISWTKYNESPEIKATVGDIVFCKTASVGKTALIKHLPKETTINPQFILLKNIKCNAAYLSYILKENTFQNKIKAITGQGTIPTFTQKEFGEITIPIPSLQEQERIVSILDKFDELVNGISQGLPAEINARRKQYEYYRNRLLTFKEKTA